MGHRRNYGPPPKKQPRLLYWSVITIIVVASFWAALKAVAQQNVPQVCIDLAIRLQLPMPKTDEEKRAARQRVWLLVEAGDEDARRCWYAINKEQRK